MYAGNQFHFVEASICPQLIQQALQVAMLNGGLIWLVTWRVVDRRLIRLFLGFDEFRNPLSEIEHPLEVFH